MLKEPSSNECDQFFVQIFMSSSSPKGSRWEVQTTSTGTGADALPFLSLQGVCEPEVFPSVNLTAKTRFAILCFLEDSMGETPQLHTISLSAYDSAISQGTSAIPGFRLQ